MSILAYKRRLSRLEEMSRSRKETRLPIRERIKVYEEIFSLQEQGKEIPEKYTPFMGIVSLCGKYEHLFV